MTTGPDTRADAWLERARAKLGAAALGPQAEQIGRVEEVGDGIALVSGLPNVRLDELLRFDKGQYGFAQVLERDLIGSAVSCWTMSMQSRPATRCGAPATWCACRSDRRCWAASSIPSGARLTGKGALRPTHRNRSSVRPPRSSTATWSVSRCRLVSSSSIRCSPSVAASENSSSATGPSARRRLQSTRSSIRKPATWSASMSRSARKRRASGVPSTQSIPAGRRSAASSWWRVLPAPRDCNGSPPSPVSPWQSISAIAASMPSWWSMI